MAPMTRSGNSPLSGPLTHIRRRRHGITAGLIGLFALAILGTDAYLLTTAKTTTTVSIDDVLADFDSPTDDAPPSSAAPTGEADTPAATPTEAPAGDTPATDPATDEQPEAEAPAPEATAPAPAAQPTEAAAPAEPTPAPAAEPAPQPQATEPAAPAPQPAFAKPAEGVYTFITKGSEQINVAGARHDYPSETFMAVKHRDGCHWYTDHRFVEEHREDRLYCSNGDVLSLLEIGTEVTFFGQTETSDYRCDPPRIVVDRRDGVGSKRTQVCHATDGSGKSEETATHHGRTSLTIGGVKVEAWHVSFDSIVSGRAEGTAHADVWVHPDSGMILKVDRQIETASQAFGTDVVYTEDVEFTLKSLTPRR